MHYTIGRLKKKNSYKITFHNNNGIKYGAVDVYSDNIDFNTVIVSIPAYESNRELVNTVADGLHYAYVEKKGDTFVPIQNSADKPKYIKFAVNNYFKATAKLVPVG